MQPVQLWTNTRWNFPLVTVLQGWMEKIGKQLGIVMRYSERPSRVLVIRDNIIRRKVQQYTGLIPKQKFLQLKWEPENQGGGTWNIFPTSRFMHWRHELCCHSHLQGAGRPNHPKKRWAILYNLQWARSGATSPSLSSEPLSCVLKVPGLQLVKPWGCPRPP